MGPGQRARGAAILLAWKQEHETEQFGTICWIIVLSKAINFLIVYSFHFPASGVFHFLLYVLAWFILEVGALRYKANNSALCPNKAKIIYLLCLSAPPSFSNMKCSRYGFSSDCELSGCQCVLNQMPQKTLGSLLHKTWQIRMIGTAGEEAQGVQA